MKIYYNQKLKSLSRRLRKNSTLSEVLLWNELKARKMKGYQFMRQKPKLESLGLSFLRFNDIEVKKDIYDVVRAIEYWIEEYEEKQPPNPLY